MIIFRSVFILLILSSCAHKQVCTWSSEELTITDTTILYVPHYNIGNYCFQARKDTIIDETILYLDYIINKKNKHF